MQRLLFRVNGDPFVQRHLSKCDVQKDHGSGNDHSQVLQTSFEGANGVTQFSVNYYFFGQISVNYYFLVNSRLTTNWVSY